MRKLILIGVIALLMIIGGLLIGCGESTTEESEELEIEQEEEELEEEQEEQLVTGPELEIDDVSFFQLDEETWILVASITNPSETMGCQYASFDIAFTSDGQTVGTTMETAGWIAPGEKRWISEGTTATASPDDAVFHYDPPDFIEYDEDEWPVLEVVGGNIDFDERLGYSALGMVENPGPVDVESASVEIICFDDEGKPVGSGGTAIFNIEIGDQMPFNFWMDGDGGVEQVFQAWSND